MNSSGKKNKTKNKDLHQYDVIFIPWIVAWPMSISIFYINETTIFKF